MEAEAYVEYIDILSQREWDEITEFNQRLVDSSRIDENSVLESITIDYLNYLAELRKKHGNHPMLIEFTADRLENPAERINLYLEAIQGYKAIAADTCSCYISMAEVYMETLDDHETCKECLDLAWEDATARNDKDDMTDVSRARKSLLGK